jgi:hypothetical protein
MEYEPKYVDAAIGRWQRMTKLEATLAGDGRTFEEIAAARGRRDAWLQSSRRTERCESRRAPLCPGPWTWRPAWSRFGDPPWLTANVRNHPPTRSDMDARRKQRSSSRGEAVTPEDAPRVPKTVGAVLRDVLYYQVVLKQESPQPRCLRSKDQALAVEK